VEYDIENLAYSSVDAFPLNDRLVSGNPPANAFAKYVFNYDPYRRKQVYPKADIRKNYLEGQERDDIGEFYKWIGQRSHDIGLEQGISPIRLQEAVKSLIGDPERNPIVNIPVKSLGFTIDLATKSPKELKEKYKNLSTESLDALGVNQRLFNKLPQADYRIEEEILKEKQDKDEKSFKLREELKRVYKSKGEEQLDIYLDKMIDEDKITRDKARDMFTEIIKDKELSKDSTPKYYRSVLRGDDNEQKAKILWYYTNKFPASQREKVKDDLIQKDIIKRKSEVWKIYEQMESGEYEFNE
jgi:hypothetical protein